MALATEIGLSNKYVSERHVYASQEKLTAGEAAKKISKALKLKVSAKEVQEHCHEWHHSGFYKSGGKSTMGRTWFISYEEVDELIANWSQRRAEIEAKKAAEAVEEKRKQETTVKGFYFKWDYDYSGRFGKKQNYKVLAVYEGSEAGQPMNFTPCENEAFQCAVLLAGKQYYGWDEPKAEEFTKAAYEAEIESRKAAEQRHIAFLKEIEDKKKAEIEEQEKVNSLLDEMQPELIAAGVNFSDNCAAWYIYSRFIEGTPKQILFSVKKIKSWLSSRNK